jgi:malate dehydrogenase (quinone)
MALFRPQSENSKRLLMGEARINPGNGVVFNMTTSPGATSCLDSAELGVGGGKE